MTVLSYTISSFCAATGLGRSRVYELLAIGDLKAIRCGRRTLIPCDEARRFIDALPPAEFILPANLARNEQRGATR
jgi:excisionase family DNA binding protein